MQHLNCFGYLKTGLKIIEDGMKYYPLPQIKGKSRYKDFYIFWGNIIAFQNNIDMTFEKNEGPGPS